MTSTAVAVRPQEPQQQVVVQNRILSPVVTIQQMHQQQDEVRALIKDVLKSGHDYGAIPGAGKKNTLLKPGAERIATMFGLTTSCTIVESEIDHDRKVSWEKRTKQYAGQPGNRRQVEDKVVVGESIGLYRYVVRVDLIDGHGQVVGSGLGSASTMESKYIDRPRDVENTILKIAFKRAHVAAVLTTVGLSDHFTQDIEDMPQLAEELNAPPELMLMPFGPSKGTPLSEMETDDLEGAVKWARDKGSFADFVSKGSAVLEARGARTAPNDPRTEKPASTPAQEQKRAEEPRESEDASSLSGVLALCPVCDGPMYDNRKDKRNPKAPDFKCQDKGCKGLYWPGQWPPKDSTEDVVEDDYDPTDDDLPF